MITQPSRFDLRLYSLPSESHNASEKVIRRANIVGRLTLYSLTIFLVFLGVAAVTSALWLWKPFAAEARFIVVHKTALEIEFASFSMVFASLFGLHRLLVPPREFAYKPVAGARVHVGLTAYNDEVCIADAVREFKACPEVHKVIVVENNSQDGTYQAALHAGADAVITEKKPGYGACCMRALKEAAAGAHIVILCEGDMTFSAHDVRKFLAYLENCDMVLGTRATQELRASKTQMDWLINPANQVVAKLIQARFWGVRLTDVGCTYRAMRVPSYRQLKDKLHVTGNHFSPHMFMEALKMRMRVIEIPVVFRLRAGESKGVGNNKIKAARVALRMLGLLYRA